MTRAQIVGIGAYAPKRILTNQDLEKMIDTSDEWIVQRTGIHERHIADESEAASDLGLRAAQQALDRAGVEPEEIDLIVVGTTSGDMAFPTTANVLQHQLGCRNAGSMDVYAACAASIYSLSVGAQYIETGKYRTVLCVGAECLSRITDYTDRGTCILLADAAGAAILRPAEGDAGIIDTDLYSDGRYGDLLIQPAGGSRHPASHETVDRRTALRQDEGQRGVQGGRTDVRGLREENPRAEWLQGRGSRRLRPASGEPPDHRGRGEAPQAPDGARRGQRRPVRQHRRGIGVRGARGSLAAKRVTSGDLVLLAAFGGGFTWGAALLRW